MLSESETFHVPSLSNSNFSAGKILWDLYRDAGRWVSDGRTISTLDFSDVLHIKPYVVAIVVGLAKKLGSSSIATIPPKSGEARDHLIRLGVPQFLGADWGSAELRESNIPLGIVADRPSDDFSFRVAEKLSNEFPGGLPAGIKSKIADCIYEIIANALGHSESSIGCVVTGQSFPQNKTIEVAIVDFGITIRGHLSRRYPQLITDELAIREAVKTGVTGTLPNHRNRLGDPNSGVGLSELKEFVEATQGELSIFSGSSLVCFGPNNNCQTLSGCPFPGTLVNIDFNTNFGVPVKGPSAVYYGQ